MSCASFLGTRFEYLVAVGDSLLRATSPEELELGDILAEFPPRHCMSFWDDEKQGLTTN